MFKSKKGEESVRSNTVALIMAAVVIAALIILIYAWADQGDEATQASLCRTSVLIRDKATIDLKVYTVEKITPLACNPLDLEQLKGSREEIKREIANKAARCWWQYAEGSVADLFKKEANEKGCRVCYFFSLPANMDYGASTSTQTQIFKESSREKDSISAQEIYNYMVFNVYNPGLIYGGGTKRYVGDYYEFVESPDIKDPREYSIKQVNSVPISSYIRDYSMLINEDAVKTINEAGAELQANGAGHLFVVVADEFSSIERADAKEIIEKLQLNSNKTFYDGILIMLDFENRKVRVEMGFELTRAVKEYELQELMKLSFDNVDEENVDSYSHALASLVTKLKNKLLFIDEGEFIKEYGINSGSYYFYLSNAGYNWPLITDIKSERTYAIAYLSPTDNLDIWDQLYEWVINSEIKGKKGRPNNILIAPVNEINQYCDLE